MTERILQATTPLAVVTDATNTTLTVASATASAQGVVELATEAETLTGSDTTRAVTAAGVKGVADLKQPLDADLTAIAALTTTVVGRSLLAAADAAAIRVIDGSIAGIRVEDEGVSTVAVATALNFAGAGVTVTDAGSGEATVTITSGGGGISGIVVKDEGVSTVAVGTALNFIGANVTVTDATSGQANVTLTGATTAQGATADAAAAKASNLSDLTNAATARTNLGLGTAATTAATAYATAAQGATADTAVQPARTITTSAPLTGGGDLSTNRTLAVSAASDTAAGVVELSTPAEVITGASGTLATTPAGVKAAIDKQPEFFTVAVGDETTAITVGTSKVSFRMPFAFTLTNLRASLVTASSVGIPTVDVNEAGVTLMTTNKLTIDATELTSTTAVTAVGITDTAIADDALMTIDVDVAGTGAAGLKVTFYGTRA